MKLPPALVSPVGDWTIRALLATVRWRTEGVEHLTAPRRGPGGLIYALWHGRLLPLAFSHRHEAIHVLVSRNVDGEYIARIVDRWGFHPVRGSSSRGARAGTRGLLDALLRGGSVAITPDGPRGPRETMKPGVARLAARSGAPIVPVAASPDRCWKFGSWDRFVVPKPFSTVLIRYGQPVYVDRQASAETLAAVTDRLGAALRELTAATDRRVREGR